MIRPLLIVFVAGIAVAVASGVIYEAIHQDRDSPDRASKAAPLETREIAWAGADRLDVATMADVTYTQGRASKITITGRAAALDHFKVDGGRIRIDASCTYSGSGFGHDSGCVDIGGLRIEVVGMSTTAFDVSGVGKLQIQNYDQPRLEIELSGLGAIEAAGRADAVEVKLSGGGKADLSDLEVKDATVDLTGLGEARIRPSEKAKIDISGGGKVDLLSHPASLESRVTGLGKVNQP